MKHEKLREFLKPDAMKRLCRDYVLEHKNPTFLSWDEVIENGKEWDDDIDYDYNGYRICDVSGEKEIPFTGLLYELFPDGSLLWYNNYEDGFGAGPNVAFFPSGELREYACYEWYETGQIKHYTVIQKKAGVWESYEWYESGMIKEYACYDKRGFAVKHIEYDEAGNITRKIKG